MRLLNTETLKLSEFYEANTPKYAILSHTWDGSETTLQDWEAGTRIDTPGHAKVLKFSEYTARRQYEWCWVDTICIDKKSSADLSEAINSMYAWYKEAGICIVYLSDVKIASTREETLCLVEASKWFTRGWTLQEFLAPEQTRFVDKVWEYIGDSTDDDPNFMNSLATATNIPEYYWSSSFYVPRCASVAQKMSWASGRQTTRIEDMAYCLMGLFEINMPLLYGERHNAFRRLQEEIIKISEDESIFAWSPRLDYPSNISPTLGCLAPYPAFFRNCGDVLDASNQLSKKSLRMGGKPAYSLLNSKLELDAIIQDPLEQWTPKRPVVYHKYETITVVLICYRPDDAKDSFCGLTLTYVLRLCLGQGRSIESRQQRTSTGQPSLCLCTAR
jgi:hypothetical protein